MNIASPIRQKIFREGAYQPDISLVEHIERLSNPHHEIDSNELANIVAKYFFVYTYEDGHESKITERDIDTMFGLFSTYGRRFNLLGNFSPSSDIERVFSHCSYQLSMLGDIGATVEICQDIISRKIDDILGNKAYVGVDLGTGTGILLLAQYIQARRNGLIPSREKNSGVEFSYFVAQYTKSIIEKLGVGTVVQGDTTEAETFSFLQETPHFIGNENLPDELVPFAGQGRALEPFFENIFILRALQNLSLSQFFPQQVLLGGEILGGYKEFDSSKSSDIDTFETLYQEQRKHPNFINVSTKIYPVSIKLNGSWRHLADVGNSSSKGLNSPSFADYTKRWK